MKFSFHIFRIGTYTEQLTKTSRRSFLCPLLEHLFEMWNISKWNFRQPLCEPNFVEVSQFNLTSCEFWWINRYEAPDDRNRWDSPLIVLQPEDPMPYDTLFDVLYQRKPPPPNQSTQSVSKSTCFELFFWSIMFWHQ